MTEKQKSQRRKKDKSKSSIYEQIRIPNYPMPISRPFKSLEVIDDNTLSQSETRAKNQVVEGNEEKIPEISPTDSKKTKKKKKKHPRGKGRRKIPIEYIRDKSRRRVTFSKRKSGLLKKAFELSILTGCQALCLITSERGNVNTYATEKFRPLIHEKVGIELIQSLLTAPEFDDLMPGDIENMKKYEEMQKYMNSQQSPPPQHGYQPGENDLMPEDLELPPPPPHSQGGEYVEQGRRNPQLLPGEGEKENDRVIPLNHSIQYLQAHGPPPPPHSQYASNYGRERFNDTRGNTGATPTRQLFPTPPPIDHVMSKNYLPIPPHMHHHQMNEPPNFGRNSVSHLHHQRQQQQQHGQMGGQWGGTPHRRDFLRGSFRYPKPIEYPGQYIRSFNPIRVSHEQYRPSPVPVTSNRGTSGLIPQQQQERGRIGGTGDQENGQEMGGVPNNRGIGDNVLRPMYSRVNRIKLRGPADQLEEHDHERNLSKNSEGNEVKPTTNKDQMEIDTDPSHGNDQEELADIERNQDISILDPSVEGLSIATTINQEEEDGVIQPPVLDDNRNCGNELKPSVINPMDFRSHIDQSSGLKPPILKPPSMGDVSLTDNCNLNSMNELTPITRAIQQPVQVTTGLETSNIGNVSQNPPQEQAEDELKSLH